ncbi:rhodanese-like domain-containing protein [Leptospira biflexa]|nr:rhodanese-like domain-containing protein [Leptospira biflexa]
MVREWTVYHTPYSIYFFLTPILARKKWKKEVNMKTFVIVGVIIGFLFVFVKKIQSKGDKQMVQEWIQSGAVVVDVRTKSEFAEGHFPGSINIPVDVLPNELGAIKNKKSKIVVYCRSGARSERAKQILTASGYSSVINAGGLGDMPNSR